MRGSVIDVKFSPPLPELYTRLNAGEKDRIVIEVVSHIDSEQEIKFTPSPDLICGIELQLAGNEIVWSLDRYVQNLDERFSMLLKEEDRTPSFGS